MKAYVLHDIDDLRYEDTEKPVVKPNEALVRVRAAGICGSDIPRIFRTGTYSYPLIPGHEFSGEVVEAGERVNKELIGKRVAVFPLIPCKVCEPCQREQYELCRSYDYLGSRTNGGFAEYVAVPEWNLMELPDNVSYEQAAMMEPMAVAVHAMRSVCSGGDMDTGTVAVCGLGTIGLLLLMFLREAGISDILVIGNKEFQRKMTDGLGISEQHFCDSRKEDMQKWLMERTGGCGVNVFFECVGKNETISEGVACTAPNGMVQLVGNPASDICFEKNIYWKILRNQLKVRGSWNSSYTHSDRDDWHYVLDRLKSGRIHPEQYITRRFDFEGLYSGLCMMRDKTEEYVKVMVQAM